MNVERFICGNGDGMFDNPKGDYVRFSDYEKLSIELEKLRNVDAPADFIKKDEKTINLNFGEAIQALKKGEIVYRQGWNGKGMYLRLVYNGKYGLDVKTFADLRIRDIELSSWIGIKTADNKFVPWLASQTDILAEDWEII